MTIEQKREIIVKNKDPIIAALTAVIDTYYNYLNPILNENNELKTEIFDDEKAKVFALDMNNDVVKYEDVLKKVKTDSPLSVKDIAYIGISIDFCIKRADEQLANIAKANNLLQEIRDNLQSPLDS